MSTMETTSFSMVGDHEIDFPEFSGQAGCLLDSIDFDDLFVGIHFDGDMLPEMEMEMDPEILAEFSTGDMEEDSATSPDTTNQVGVGVLKCSFSNEDCISKVSGCVSDGESKKVSVSEMETKMDKEDEVMESEKSRMPNLRAKKGEKTKISPSSHAKNNNNNNNMKRKTKVDWTPDLHRRFVQAVEQLGVDKAVPSRILELMGVGRLTRHNIASHLQKYRTHRKHLQAREAEAASWSKKRQVFGAIAVVPPTTGGGKVKVMNHPWPPPTIGFPPPGTPPPPHHHHHPAFHPLHVWGHPTHLLDQNHPIMPGVWPKQLVPSPSPLPQPLFWHSHHQYRFAPPLVQGIPPPHVSMYKPEHGAQSSPNQPPTDSHPTKERIDEAIGDVLTKPWLPLPIGLKPPSMEGVIEELQRQGVPNIPPSKSL